VDVIPTLMYVSHLAVGSIKVNRRRSHYWHCRVLCNGWVSVRLSTAAAACGGFAAERPRDGSTTGISGQQQRRRRSMAISCSKCEQCHVYSRCTRLNTDLLQKLLSGHSCCTWIAKAVSNSGIHRISCHLIACHKTTGYSTQSMVYVVPLAERWRSGCARVSTLSALVLILPSPVIHHFTRGTSISVPWSKYLDGLSRFSWKRWQSHDDVGIPSPFSACGLYLRSACTRVGAQLHSVGV